MDYNPDGDDVENQDWEPYAGRNGALFMIDCAEPAFGENGINFKEGFSIIKSMMMNGIIANEKDMLGIIFYNVENSPGPVNEIDSDVDCLYKNVAIFMSLKQTSADMIKYIHRFMENDLYDFPTKYGHSSINPRAFIDAFWLCSKMFKSSDYKLEERTIFLLTTNPEPFTHGSDDERNAYKKAKDLAESGIVLQIVPLTDVFDTEPFYRQFYEVVMELDLELDPTKIRDLLRERTFCPNYRKRSLGKVKIKLAGDVEFSVSIYPTSRKARPPKKVHMTKDTNEIITSKMVHVVPSTTMEVDDDVPAAPSDAVSGSASVEPRPAVRTVLPGDQMRFLEIGEEQVSFTNTEYQQMRRIMAPSLKILGFKAADAVKETNHLRRPLFIYPNEEWMKGSTALFTALWLKCLEKKKVAFALMVARLGSYPKLVALVPQRAFEDDHFARSDGFRVEFIPFKESVRLLDNLSGNTVLESQDDELFLMKKVVKSLRINYHAANFVNPSVTHKYTQIESTILDEEPEELKDSTIPDTAGQDQRVEKLIDQMNECFGEDVAVAEKRKPAATAGPRVKAQKKTDVVDVATHYNNGTLDKLSVDQLKAYLTEAGHKGLSKQKKMELVERVERHIAQNKLF